MATHFQIRDGSLLPTEGTYIRQSGQYIIFTLGNGLEIKEFYNYGEAAMTAAYNLYMSALLSGTSPLYFTLIDSVTGLPVSISVDSGVLSVSSAAPGSAISSIALTDSGNSLPTTLKVENGVLTIDQ